MQQSEVIQRINFRKTEVKIVEDDDGNFKEQCYIAQKIRNCVIIPVDSGLSVTAYKFPEDPPEGEPDLNNRDVSTFNKINIYSVRNTGETGDKSIDEDFWYIKLTIKKKDEQPYVYINFIRSVINNRLDDYPQVKLGTIIEIIKTITVGLGYKRIVLQDDAEFSCGSDEGKYSLKAMYLRALDKDPKRSVNNISIYGNYAFTPTKFQNENMKPCIDSLHLIDCRQLLKVSEQLQKILTRIAQKEINYTIYRMLINPNPSNKKLDINYTDIKLISYSSICTTYIDNLDKIISFLRNKDLDKSIYDFYKELCEKIHGSAQSDKNAFQENKDCCNSRKEFLTCLRNSINSYVIIVKGTRVAKIETSDKCIEKQELASSSSSDINSQAEIKNEDSDSMSQLDRFDSSNDCSVSLPGSYQRQDSGTPIIITKLFNLFNGTFEKLKNIYNEMEFIIE